MHSPELWVGQVEVRPLPSSELANTEGAFVNVVTWAVEPFEFHRKARLVLQPLDLQVVGFSNIGRLNERSDIDSEDLLDMIDRARRNSNAIIFGTFHTWTEKQPN